MLNNFAFFFPFSCRDININIISSLISFAGSKYTFHNKEPRKGRKKNYENIN